MIKSAVAALALAAPAAAFQAGGLALGGQAGAHALPGGRRLANSARLLSAGGAPCVSMCLGGAATRAWHARAPERSGTGRDARGLLMRLKNAVLGICAAVSACEHGGPLLLLPNPRPPCLSICARLIGPGCFEAVSPFEAVGQRTSCRAAYDSPPSLTFGMLFRQLSLLMVPLVSLPNAASASLAPSVQDRHLVQKGGYAQVGGSFLLFDSMKRMPECFRAFILCPADAAGRRLGNLPCWLQGNGCSRKGRPKDFRRPFGKLLGHATRVLVSAKRCVLRKERSGPVFERSAVE